MHEDVDVEDKKGEKKEFSHEVSMHEDVEDVTALCIVYNAPSNILISCLAVWMFKHINVG